MRPPLHKQKQIFDAGEIASSGARNLPELLKKKAGIDIHSMNGNPILTSIAMRGFGDNAFGRVKEFKKDFNV